MKIDPASNIPATRRPQPAAGSRSGAESFASVLSAARSEQQAGGGKPVDFTSMTRQEIADIGNQLFRDGKITLDELFRFDHPDGILRVNGQLPPGAASTDKLDFLKLTQKALADMEATGEASREKSSYSMLKGLLGKLQALQGQTIGGGLRA